MIRKDHEADQLKRFDTETTENSVAVQPVENQSPKYTEDEIGLMLKVEKSMCQTRSRFIEYFQDVKVGAVSIILCIFPLPLR